MWQGIYSHHQNDCLETTKQFTIPYTKKQKILLRQISHSTSSFSTYEMIHSPADTTKKT